jgi:[lysine-biosynthesis-protein LysW]--L-2-aminoadipate ligase
MENVILKSPRSSVKIGESETPSLARTFSIIFDRTRWEEKALIKAAKRKRIKINLIDAKNTSFDITSEDLTEPYGDIVLQRCISYFRGLHVSAILEKKGIKVVNSFDTTSICGNKMLTSLALSKAKVPTPKTFVAFTPETALEKLDEIGYPAVIKPVIGSWGRLVAPIRDRATAEAILEHREQMGNSLLQIHYIQEMVKRPPRDIRTIVVGNEITAAIYRSSPEGSWRTNVALGATTTACPITSELEDAALKAAKAVGGGILAVDLMESPKGNVVHEINSTIEFRGAESGTGVDIASKILEYLTKISKK